MQLGAFSISLAVKNLEASRQFYEKFGFTIFGGNAAQNWLILKNGDTIIGLFQGMFDKNILTFNPGWDANAQEKQMVSGPFSKKRSSHHVCSRRHGWPPRHLDAFDDGIDVSIDDRPTSGGMMSVDRAPLGFA